MIDAPLPDIGVPPLRPSYVGEARRRLNDFAEWIMPRVRRAVNERVEAIKRIVARSDYQGNELEVHKAIRGR